MIGGPFSSDRCATASEANELDEKRSFNIKRAMVIDLWQKGHANFT
jgi:hypothetical protein